MKSFRWLAFSVCFFLIACQPSGPSKITIIDGTQAHTIDSTDRLPISLLTQAGIIPQPYDRVLLNGNLLPIDQALPSSDFIQLQLRHGVPITINSAQGQKVIQSSALTIGQALTEVGYELYVDDLVDPPINTPITGPITVNYSPARDLSVFVGGQMIRVHSSASTVGEVLAEAGIPLMGLDISSPLENEAPPADGQIRVVRVTETVNVSLEPIPFTTKMIDSPDVAVGQQQTIQPGENGLAMVRTRIRYEDGKEVSRKAETQTVVRAAQDRIVATGSQVVLAPVPASGVPDNYWLAYPMYATVYSPCQSGTGGCSFSTASGAPAGKGIVAVDYSIYSYLAGMKVYIPGYGIATIGDTGGGPIIESALNVPRTKWIDLGFNEGKIVDMTGWVTVYFLAPAPAEIPYFLK